MRAFKRGTKWWIDFSWRGQRFREAGGRTKLDALARGQARLAEMEAGGSPTPSYARKAFTVADLAKTWLESDRAQRKASKSGDVRRLATWTEILGARTQADTLKRADIERAIGELRVRPRKARRHLAKPGDKRAPISPAEVNRHIAVLRSAIRHAIKLDLLTRNPIAGIELAKEPPRTVLITEQQYAALVEGADPELRRAIVLGRETACRQGELVNARWSAVDLNARTLTLDASETKADEGRVVPLSRVAIEELGATPQAERVGKIFRSTPTAIGQRFRHVADRLGYTQVRFHDLRALATVDLLRAQIPIPTIMKVTGHLTPSVLTKHYARLDSTDALAAVDAVAARRAKPAR